MGADRFKVVSVNPNDTSGGGGCLCSETKNPDCEGPFAVFEAAEMENPLSPTPVLCLSCAEAVVATAAGGDILAGGEPSPEAIETSAVEITEQELLEAIEAPRVTDDDDAPSV